MAQTRMTQPLPLVVLTGFLGAGKTTLLNRLLRDEALSQTLVIINEFGEIPLDHLFVEALSGDMMMLSSGCLCCTIRGDLASTLESLIERRKNGEIPSLDRIILETTGLADPAPILQTIMAHPLLLLNFRLESVVTLVDAANGLDTLAHHVEARKQAAVADRIVLTKTDLAPLSQELDAALTQLNPTARRLEASQATAVELLDAGLYTPDSKSPDVRRWLNAEAIKDHHHHHHDINRHNAQIRAFCLRSDAAISPASFDIFIELLRALHGPNLLRVKGIIKMSDRPEAPVVIHGVQHIFHPPVRLAQWPDDDYHTRIVFIVQNMDPATLEATWAAFTGTPVTDTADADSFVKNPLKMQSGGLLA